MTCFIFAFTRFYDKVTKIPFAFMILQTVNFGPLHITQTSCEKVINLIGVDMDDLPGAD